MRTLALATAALSMVAGFAVAQETETTTESHATNSTTVHPDAKKGQPAEEYQWSVDTTTTKVPVHPTVVEKQTTTTTVAPPPVVDRRTTVTTTTSSGDQ
jgi:hypothetical protein